MIEVLSGKYFYTNIRMNECINRVKGDSVERYNTNKKTKTINVLNTCMYTENVKLIFCIFFCSDYLCLCVYLLNHSFGDKIVPKNELNLTKSPTPPLRMTSFVKLVIK